MVVSHFRLTDWGSTTMNQQDLSPALRLITLEACSTVVILRLPTFLSLVASFCYQVSGPSLYCIPSFCFIKEEYMGGKPPISLHI